MGKHCPSTRAIALAKKLHRERWFEELSGKDSFEKKLPYIATIIDRYFPRPPTPGDPVNIKQITRHPNFGTAMGLAGFALFVILVLVALITAPGCSDAYWDSTFSYNEAHKITLYSGGKAVRTWTSTGKVESETNSDGYFFRDQLTQMLVRVTGDIVIEIVQ